MQQRIIAIVLDIASAIALGLGIAILLLPLVLHLWVGADDDSYIMIVEWGRDMVVLLEVGLEWMFRPRFLLWPALLIFVGLGLRWLVRHWSRAKSSL